MPSVLELPIEPGFLPTVQAYLETTAARYCMETADCATFARAGTDLVGLILQCAFEPGQESSLEISCKPIEAGLEVVVRDRGLPVDEGQWDNAILQRIRENADRLQFVNRGAQGRETRLTKYFQRLAPMDKEPPCDDGRKAGDPETEPLELRRLQPGDAVHVSRCVYRCYGYSYGANEAIYFPERLEALNQSGQILSVVATNPRGEVVGHVALERSRRDAVVAVAGVAAVSPVYRSRGLASKLCKMVIEEGQKDGAQQIQAFAVTSHPYSQRLLKEYGFKACSLCLATAYYNFKGIKEEPDQRESLVGALLRLKPVPPEQAPSLYPPMRHRAMIETLCAEIELPARFPELGPVQLPQEPAAIVVQESPVRNLAKIHVERYGNDTVQQVRKNLQYLRRQDYRQLSLTLPLADPNCATVVPKLEKSGFFFGGLIVRDLGVCLLMQYLHGVAIEYDKIIVESEMAKELRAYIRCLDPGAV